MDKHTINYAGWFEIKADTYEQAEEQAIHFLSKGIIINDGVNGEWEITEGDDSWVENELMAMKQHLDGWQVPAAADDCEHCKYFAERTRIAEEVGGDD